MGNIINTKDNTKYKIEKFTFNKLDSNEEEIVIFTQNPFEENKPPVIEENKNFEPKIDTSPPPPKNNKELLEKIEQLTSDVISLQMELEKKEEDFKQELQQQKDQSFQEGKAEGMQSAQEQFTEDIENYKMQYLRSIEQLDEHKQLYDKALNELEHELLQGSFVLAQKIIIKEIDEYSSQIATKIAQSLLKTIKEGSEVTLKVNPSDFKDISSHFKDNRIKIEADEAIQKGGVIILSDSGNIDGDILTRYKQSLQLLQKES